MHREAENSTVASRHVHLIQSHSVRLFYFEEIPSVLKV